MPFFVQPTYRLRRDQHIADNLDDSILGNAIFNSDLGKAVDFDADQSTKAANIDAEYFVIQDGR